MAKFDGFHFENMPFINEVKVLHSFSSGAARFLSYITDINLEAQTFSVCVEANYIFPCEIHSALSFQHNGKDVPIQESINDFSIIVEDKTAVTYDNITFQEKMISLDDKVSFTFQGFEIHNILDLDVSKLTVHHTFNEQQKEAIVTTNITSSGDNKVDITFSFENVLPAFLSSKLIFYYDNTELDEQLNYDFNLNLIIKPTIYQPKGYQLDCVLENDSCKITIPDFKFLSISDSSLVTVSSHFELPSGSASASIVN